MVTTRRNLTPEEREARALEARGTVSMHYAIRGETRQLGELLWDCTPEQRQAIRAAAELLRKTVEETT